MLLILKLKSEAHRDAAYFNGLAIDYPWPVLEFPRGLDCCRIENVWWNGVHHHRITHLAFSRYGELDRCIAFDALAFSCFRICGWDFGYEAIVSVD